MNKAKWPSGLRRQFKALVFGRGFEPHLCQNIFFPENGICVYAGVGVIEYAFSAFISCTLINLCENNALDFDPESQISA